MQIATRTGTILVVSLMGLLALYTNISIDSSTPGDLFTIYLPIYGLRRTFKTARIAKQSQF